MDLRDALIDWDDPNDEGSNTAHIGEHDLTPERQLDVRRERLVGPSCCFWPDRNGAVYRSGV